MNRKLTIYILAVIGMLWACDDREEIFQGSLTFSATNLLPLDDGLDYNLWMVLDSGFILIGIINPDDQGNVQLEDNTLDEATLLVSTALAVSIEDATVDPSNIGPIIIAGDWAGPDDSLGLGHSLALGNSLRVASGQYSVQSPSSDSPNDTLSGIWYYDTTFIDTLTLFIPELTDQWIYQSWLQVDELYLNMGQFRLATAADNSSIFSGPNETFGFPGEDFIENAPPGLTFPLDVRGHRVLISIQPILDVAPSEPFFIIPLSDIIRSDSFLLLPPDLNFLFREDMIFPGGSAKR